MYLKNHISSGQDRWVYRVWDEMAARYERLLFFTWKNSERRNKAKERISKRVLQLNEARQIFRKTNIPYPLIDTRTCTYQGVRNVSFSENMACFFLLLPTYLGPCS